jgi:hypothetical protein
MKKLLIIYKTYRKNNLRHDTPFILRELLKICA